MKNQRGSALLEAIVCSKALLVFFGIALTSIYVFIAIYWTDFWSYRAMICMLPESTPYRCQQRLVEQLQWVIPTGHFTVEELWITSRKTAVSVSIHLFSVNSSNQKMFSVFSHRIHKEISLPLTRGVSLLL